MDELYVLARRVLLDALEALGPHRSAVVLAGAQAVYLRVGEADLAVAPFTTDGDLVLEPGVLEERPPLEEVLRGAGFQPSSGDSVGIWVTHRPLGAGSVSVSADLLVPAYASVQSRPAGQEGLEGEVGGSAPTLVPEGGVIFEPGS